MSVSPDPSRSRYLSVNVYPARGGWRMAVLVRQAGRPYPRLLRKVVDEALHPESPTLRGALRAASERLQALADDPHL